MGLLDDLSGSLGGLADVGSTLIKAAMPAVNQYLTNSMQLKQAKKIAKVMAPGGGFPQLGTGNMRFGGLGSMPAASGMMYGFGDSTPGVMNASGGVGNVPYGPAIPPAIGPSTGNSY